MMIKLFRPPEFNQPTYEELLEFAESMRDKIKENLNVQDENKPDGGHKMKKIEIFKNNLGDTRTAGKMPTFEEVMNASRTHQKNVRTMMYNFSQELYENGKGHDYTKTEPTYCTMFYEAMARTMLDGAKFEDSDWAKLHYDVLERHHLKRHVPEDVNLIDVIEMICDNVEAGAARSGNIVRSIDLQTEVLQKAFENTVKMISDSVIITGWEGRYDEEERGEQSAERCE